MSLVVSGWLKSLLIGQLLAVLCAGTIICAANLSAMHPNSNFPSLLAFLNYCLCSTYLLRPMIFSNDAGRFVLEAENGNDDGLRRTARSDGQAIKQGSYQNDTNLSPTIRDKNHIGYNACCCPDLSNAAMPKPGERLPSVWWYVLAAFLDLQANFWITQSYNYTNMTSVSILDSFSIPAVMIISVSFLRSKFQWKHYIGVSMCCIGVVGVVLNDRYIAHRNSDRDGGETGASLFGDLLAVLGAFLYACSNVLQEKLVKYGEREQYVGRIGMFGTIFALIQFFIFGFTRFESTWPLSGEAVLYMMGFVLSLFFFYTNTSQFLTQNDAVLFNLSLCASDVYSVIYAYFVFNTHVNWLYILCTVLIFIGIVLYHCEKPPQEKSLDFVTATDDQHPEEYNEPNSTFPSNASNRDNNNDDAEVLRGQERREVLGNLEAAFRYNPLSDMADEDSEQLEYRF